MLTLNTNSTLDYKKPVKYSVNTNEQEQFFKPKTDNHDYHVKKLSENYYFTIATLSGFGLTTLLQPKFKNTKNQLELYKYIKNSLRISILALGIIFIIETIKTLKREKLKKTQEGSKAVNAYNNDKFYETEKRIKKLKDIEENKKEYNHYSLKDKTLKAWETAAVIVGASLSLNYFLKSSKKIKSKLIGLLGTFIRGTLVSLGLMTGCKLCIDKLKRLPQKDNQK